MYKIKGRLNTAVAPEKDPELRDKCEKVMRYYRDADRPDFKDLTEEQLKKVEEFWKPYAFIYKVDPYVHRFYMNVTGQFDERYIPEDLQKYHMSRYFMDQDYVEAFKDKNYTELLLKELPMPKTLVHKIAGAFRDADYNPITVDEAVDIIIAQKKVTDTEKIAVMKPAMGTSRGSGLRPIGRRVTKNEVKRMLLTWRPDIEVQEIIRQHPALASIHDKSVNTIRVLSMLRGDRCEIISACLRAGRGGVFVDGGNRGGLNCGIGMDGRLKGPFHDKWGNVYEKHPDRDFDPEGFAVPGFQNLIEVIKKQHLHFPQLRLISWDFSIDADENPVFIEWNMKGDTQLHQYNNGPLYGEKTREILDEFFSSAFKEVEKDGVIYREFIDHAEAGGALPETEELVIASEINGKPVTKVSGRAFFRNEKIRSADLGQSVREIEYLAFFGCSALEEVKFPEGLEIIGEAAFANCAALKGLMTMNNVTQVMQRAFLNCSSIETVTLGDKIQRLEFRAFSGCKSLREFSAGISMRRIEDRAFQGCSLLQKVDLKAEKITALARSFLNCASLQKEPIEKKCGFVGINCFKGCLTQEEK